MRSVVLTQMTLQQFADRHRLEITDNAIQGPNGQIRRGRNSFYYWCVILGNRTFDPISEAGEAIHAIGRRALPQVPTP